MDIRHYRLLVALAELESLSGAAKRLGCTLSAASHRIHEAERRTGLRLVEKHGRRLELTAQGQRLADTGRAIVAASERAIGEARAQANGEMMTLRLGLGCFTSFRWLPEMIGNFRKRHPEVQVDVAPEVTRRPLEALLAGEIDVGLLSQSGPHPDVALRPFRCNEWLLVVSGGHRLKDKAFVVPADLKGESYVGYGLDDDRDFGLRQFVRSGKDGLKQVVRVELTEAILGLVAAGLGVAILPKWVISGAPQTTPVVSLRLGRGGTFRKWQIASRKSDRNAHVLQFAKEMSRTVEDNGSG